ncbi:hypothetical protein F5876DRAFT_69152 [Lentinula aff. lateritia]|uniref:Uncharacterized protein n=1 Tax=Lentinula aff. lateritia TaxID=2804960 RepID=A0ACC1TNS4_9AGAR|nr:hypothetical protein F5876DRAFT_69152 [Lentinula aff. lateritia]
MRLNYRSNPLVYGVLAAAAMAVGYGAPLNNTGTSDISLSNSLFTNNSSPSAETLHARGASPSQTRRKIQMTFQEPHAARLGSHPPTPPRVKKILEEVITDWLRTENQPTNIALEFTNEFKGDMGQKYEVQMGSEVWEEKCALPLICQVQLVDYADDFNGQKPIGWQWDVLNDMEVLHVVDESRLLPPYTPVMQASSGSSTQK